MRTLRWFIWAALSALILSVQALAQAPASKQVEVFGQKIHYLEAGSGATVVLLHGLGGDGSNWALTLPALAKNFHVFVPDQIGFGDSDKPMIEYRVGTLVDFLDASVAGRQLAGRMDRAGLHVGSPG
jgi:2-hydroxy-6-oxonona-2,4-dienedioate hydrolase